MKTLEMIKDWQESGFKKKYIQTNWCSTLPRTVSNNGSGVLMYESFNVTVKDPVKVWGVLAITNKELDSEWEEIKQEYDIFQALEKFNDGDTMISLASSRVVRKESRDFSLWLFSIDEINGMWIEKY